MVCARRVPAAGSATAGSIGGLVRRRWAACRHGVAAVALVGPAGQHGAAVEASGRCHVATLIRINQIIRGWANYFRHAVATRTFRHLGQYTWWRLVHWQRTLHRWRWKDVRRWLTGPNGRWRPITAGEVTLFDPCSIPIRRYRYRGNRDAARRDLVPVAGQHRVVGPR